MPKTIIKDLKPSDSKTQPSNSKTYKNRRQELEPYDKLKRKKNYSKLDDTLDDTIHHTDTKQSTDTNEFSTTSFQTHAISLKNIEYQKEILDCFDFSHCLDFIFCNYYDLNNSLVTLNSSTNTSSIPISGSSQQSELLQVTSSYTSTLPILQECDKYNNDKKTEYPWTSFEAYYKQGLIRKPTKSKKYYEKFYEFKKKFFECCGNLSYFYIYKYFKLNSKRLDKFNRIVLENEIVCEEIKDNKICSVCCIFPSVEACVILSNYCNSQNPTYIKSLVSNSKCKFCIYRSCCNNYLKESYELSKLIKNYEIRNEKHKFYQCYQDLIDEFNIEFLEFIRKLCSEFIEYFAEDQLTISLTKKCNKCYNKVLAYYNFDTSKCLKCYILDRIRLNELPIFQICNFKFPIETITSYILALIEIYKKSIIVNENETLKCILCNNNVCNTPLITNTFEYIKQNRCLECYLNYQKESLHREFIKFSTMNLIDLKNVYRKFKSHLTNLNKLIPVYNSKSKHNQSKFIEQKIIYISYILAFLENKIKHFQQYLKK